MRRFLFSFFLLFLLTSSVLQAQIQVKLEIKRRLYMMYEPLVATVTIRNLSGRDLPLEDDGAQPWFGFTIYRADGRLIPPSDINYTLAPVIIPANQTVRQKITLNHMYPVNELGTYRIRAAIYFAPLQKFFESREENVEISEGRVLWQQQVGVPESESHGDLRRMTLLTFRQPKSNYLYVRMEDVASGAVLCSNSIGRLITGLEPSVELDTNNHLHVLHVTDAKTYLHTEVDYNGNILGQETYLAVKYRPSFRRNKQTGVLSIAGGQRQSNEPVVPGTNLPAGIPRLSDRPVDLPR